MCTAPLEGLYQKFKISSDENEALSSTEPLPKKQKKGIGLARFMFKTPQIEEKTDE